MDLDLKGKRALVCGSTQGMGLSIGKELANQNARVTLFARNEEVLKQVVKELPGSDHDYLVADFNNLEGVAHAATESLQKGDYQILVNNTGGPAPGKIYEAEVKDFETAMKRHLYVSQTLLKLVLPGMQKANYGRVVNIISTSVRIPINGLGVSNTVRGAMASWAKTMANELGPFGITVNNILPGFINTGRITSLISSRSKTQARAEAEIEAEMVSSIPAGRFGEPEEIGDYAAFLCSPSGAYINGTSLQVDGGRTGSI
ncbi:MAG: SDR family oxidoreductase [Cyclobacteriaceae bacterium]